MAELDRFVGVDFQRFKAFRRFTLDLKHFNILVGPNNAGKSTILAAFRMLAHAMRRAQSRKAELVHGPNGMVHGYRVDLSQISVAEENLFFEYNDDEAASVRFRLASGNSLQLYFPEQGTCHLIPDAQGRAYSSPGSFKGQFRCPIGFVPILGPVEQIEELNERETARRALFNYRAARNFRNTWYYFPEGFDALQEMIKSSWPGMELSAPEINRTHEKPRLELWCPEQRKPREIAWAGFGFQVWCQMLTNVVRWRESSIFLIDEPDIYLHSDLQRQLLGILRTLGPDIVLATHSTEIVTEAETDDIVLIDKHRPRSRRLKRPEQLGDVFALLGSTINPVLTQIAKTRRVLFVEGDDFQILGRFARRLGYDRVANRADFAVVRVEGFNPERIRNLKAGMEETLGVQVAAAAILDADYRSKAECLHIERDLGQHCQLVKVHDRKEIENFLLVPEAIDRAATLRLRAQLRRGGVAADPRPIAHASLEQFAEQSRHYVSGQRLAAAKRFERDMKTGAHEEIINERELKLLDAEWTDLNRKLRIIGGKEALSKVSKDIHDQLGISITSAGVIEAMRIEEIPTEMKNLILTLDAFVRKHPPGSDES